MQLSECTYTGPTDLLEMIALGQEYPQHNLHTADLPYRFSSWALDDPRTITLWKNEHGQLFGWAVMQTPFWTVDFACRPEAETQLFPRVLAWADERACQLQDTPFGLPSWFFNVFSGQTARRSALEAAGYIDQYDLGEDSWSKVLLRRPASLPVKDYPLPRGFPLRPLAGAAEVDQYVELHRSVFQTKNMTAPWRARTLRQPGYTPELDIVAVAPDGTLAAFCIGWLNRVPGQPLTGRIEPLGCRAEYRRYALGRIVLAEVLRRMQASGVTSMQVETDNYRDTAFGLYTHMGFEVEQEVRVYGKDFPL